MKKSLQTYITTHVRLLLVTLSLVTLSSFTNKDFTVPVINSSSVDTNTGTGFRLVVNVNFGPSKVYWVVTQSSTVPTNAQIKAGQNHLGAAANDNGNIAISLGQINSDRNSGGDISGLTANSQYYVHFYAEDDAVATDQSAAQTIAVSTDITAPAFTLANLTSNTGTDLQVNFTLNDDGQVYYVVTNSGTAPSKAQVLAGQDHTGAALPATQTGTLNVTSGMPVSDAVTGLSAATKYRIHYYAKDESNNETAAVDTRNEPIRNSSSTGTITTSGFTLTAQYDMDGNAGAAGIYYVVTQSNTVPSVTQILAGQDHLGAAADASGDFQFNTNTNANEVITGLDEGTLYYVHFLAVNNAGSHSEIATEDETTGVTPPSITAANISNNLGASLTFNVTVSKNSTVFYVVTSNLTDPSKAQIEAGDDQGNVDVPSGSLAVIAATPANVSVPGLTPGTKYRVYFFARDGFNAESAIDYRTEPQWVSSSTGTVTTSGFTLTARFDMDGNDPGKGIYYVVTTNPTAPTPAQVLAGQNEGGSAALASGSFSFTAGGSVNQAITGLDDGTLYYTHFLLLNDVDSQSEIRTEDETTADGTPPLISSLTPADNATGVDLGTASLLLTFNENINNINTAASSDNQRIILFEEVSPGVYTDVLTLDRDDSQVNLGADGSDNTASVDISGYALKANTNYYVLVGNQVYEDSPGTNDFAGLTTTTSWNFRTSGVTLNNAASSICTGSFQPIGDIIISENGIGDFNNSGTLEIELVNTSDYIFSTSGITVGETGSDITAISVQSASFSKITITYTLAGGTTLDVITISGISVFAAPGAPATTIRRSGGTASQDGNNGTGVSSLTYAQVSVGASPPAAPVLAAAQDLNHCQDENIAAKTLTLQNQPGVTFYWFTDASLSTPTPTASTASTTVNVVTDLGLSSAVAGTFDFYVVAVTTCQSSSTRVDVVVAPRPTADAGALKTVCENLSIQIGGAPTVLTPTQSPYTYSWSGPGVINNTALANPTVTPPTTASATQDFIYTVTVTDANSCASLPANATVRVLNVTAPSFTTPIQYTFNVNNDPILLQGSPSINSTFTGTAVYSNGTDYYFDPEVAGINTHNVTYSTDLANGCRTSLTQPFVVNNAAGNVFGLADSYCSNEGFDAISYNGSVWKTNIDNFNATSPTYDYIFVGFSNYYGDAIGNDGLINNGGGNYTLDIANFDHPYGSGSYTYIALNIIVDYVDPLLIDYQTVYSYQGFRIFDVTPVSFTGLTSGLPISTQFCDKNQTFVLTGNFANNNSTFEISRNNSTFFDGATSGLINTGNGTATFDPSVAFNSDVFTGTGATGPTTFYIRYSYNFPNTTGSDSNPCSNFSTQTITIYPLPTVAFNASPANNAEFCYDAAVVPISGTTNGTNLQFQGYGVGTSSFLAPTGTSSFDPDVAFEAKEFADNTTYTTPQTVTLTAVATSAQGCTNTTTRNLVVRPLPPATFAVTPRLLYCYEDADFTIDGAQTNASYSVLFKGSAPAGYTVNIPSPDFVFNAKSRFDEAVANGASSATEQVFDVTYTTSDVAGCTNATLITLTVNPALSLEINGLTAGSVLCENNGTLNLSGNFPGAGKFESRTDASAFADAANGLVNENLPSGNGLATLNLALAYDAADVGNDGGQENFYVRYRYRGATCTGDALHVEAIQILPPPALTFIAPSPANNDAFCYDQGAVPATVALKTNVPSNSTVTFTGLGITDLLNGDASFNPTLAFQQTELAQNTTLTTDQTISITARAVDNTYSCVTELIKPLVARALPPASFLYNNKVEYCYEDLDQALDGQQLTAKYDITFKNSVTPANYTVTQNQADINFDPSFYFDESVLRGSNGLATLEFDVVYTATAVTGCTRRLNPVTFKVSPRIPVEIAGVEDGDIFCSNLGERTLSFNPPGGTFRINNGSPENIPDARYSFDPPLTGPATGSPYKFTYVVITGSSCTSTTEKNITVLPSPQAIFSVAPRCEDDLIEYAANGSSNLGSALYTWTLIDSVRTGQTIQHRFPGASTYSVQLKVEHPAFNSDPTLVCKDSLRLDQIVGTYPVVDFDFFRVCEDQQAEFEVNTNIPISDVRWNFGDGEIIDFDLLSSTITGSSTTTGTHENPTHQFPGSNQYLVSLIGRTAANFGSCADTITRQVTILKKLSPVASAPYSMQDLDGGQGFWRVEDRNGASSWEFAVPTGPVIQGTTAAWTTDADGPYLASDNSYMNSPCFDLTGFDRPVLSLSHWSDTEASDGTTLQYSIDGGETWERLGDIGTGLDWFNRFTISSNPGNVQAGEATTGWSNDAQTAWASGKHSLDDITPAQRAQLRFRIAFGSFNNLEGRDGFAFQDVKIEERNRTILVENFTNMASNTGNNNTEFRDFKPNATTSELVRIQYHTSLGGEDPFNTVNPVDNSARAGFYGVTASSQGFIDGYSQGDFDDLPNWTETEFSLRSLVASPIELTLTSPGVPADLFNVQATVRLLDNLPQGKYVVHVAVIEEVVGSEAYVLRKLLPNAAGTELTIRNSQEVQTIDVSYDLRFVEDPAQVNVVAFVQAIEWENPTQRKEVLQAKLLINTDLTIPTEFVTGIDSEGKTFEAFPNPADQEMIVTLPKAVTESTPLLLVDQLGKVVSEVRFEKGEQRKQVSTAALSSGVYILKIDTPQGVLMKKVIVSHRQ